MVKYNNAKIADIEQEFNNVMPVLKTAKHLNEAIDLIDWFSQCVDVYMTLPGNIVTLTMDNWDEICIELDCTIKQANEFVSQFNK